MEKQLLLVDDESKVARLIRRALQAFNQHRELVDAAWQQHVVAESYRGDLRHVGESAPLWFVAQLGIADGVRELRRARRLAARREVQLELDLGGRKPARRRLDAGTWYIAETR